MFCNHCGKQITDGSAFCSFCGTRQQVQGGVPLAKNPVPQTQTPSVSRSLNAKGLSQIPVIPENILLTLKNLLGSLPATKFFDSEAHIYAENTVKKGIFSMELLLGIDEKILSGIR